MRSILYTFLTTALLLCISCGEDTLPKPKGKLSLAYPSPSYIMTKEGCPYSFENNSIGDLKFKNDCSATITYPTLNGSIFITYRKIDGNIQSLLQDAQKLTYEHSRKADNILEEKYVNDRQNAYGMFYDLSGDAASQAQFYITDSTNHFLSGSVYFNAKPNYDSIYPAAIYLKNDIKHLMETVTWTE